MSGKRTPRGSDDEPAHLQVDRRASSELVRWTEDFVAAIGLASDGKDPEGVHRLRIAIARLRVWLTLGGWRVLEDDLHWLRDRAAHVRDLDVQLAGAPPQPIADGLRTERAIAHADLRCALDHPRIEGLLRAVQVLPPLSRSAARVATAKLARQALRRARRAMRPPGDPSDLHALRRAVRRVRFALEWLGERPRAVERLQDALGVVGDRMVAMQTLERHGVGGPRTESYRRELQAELDAGARRARELWRSARAVLEETRRWNSC